MALFYVLPSRPFVGDHLAGYLSTWLPGSDWDADTRVNLVESVRAAATCSSDVYLVFRDELPDNLVTSESLRHALGAEPGDEVIEVRSPGRAGEPTSQRWNIRPAA